MKIFCRHYFAILLRKNTFLPWNKKYGIEKFNLIIYLICLATRKWVNSNKKFNDYIWNILPRRINFWDVIFFET